jgi:arylsulfatase A-like enzyme
MLGEKSATSRLGSRRGGRFPRSLMLISLLSALTALAPEPPAAKYNLLLISIDTLRADHLKCYGYNLDTSPHLDQLAKEGVLFEHATATASWTVPSHMSMFTSLYASAHGVQSWTGQLREGIPTLAQRLSESGFVTKAFVTKLVLSHEQGFNRGFQSYDDFSAGGAEHPGDISNIIKRPGTDLGPKITKLGTEWLKEHSQEKFFLFLHYYDCHSPYMPPGSLANKFKAEYAERGSKITSPPGTSPGIQWGEQYRAAQMPLYDGEIAFTDEYVGKILQALDDLRLSDKTLVIVLSDHGEAFFEHGQRMHGSSLYEEQIHVPLMMRLPGVIPAGERIGGNASQVDIMPTALGLLGVKASSQIQMQGIDLSPVILGGQPVPERLIYSELATSSRNLRAVRWGDWKLVGTVGKLRGAQLEQVRGNGEKVIAGVDVEKDCSEAAVRAFAEGPPSIPKANAAKAAEPDAERMRQLKSLGYAE